MSRNSWHRCLLLIIALLRMETVNSETFDGREYEIHAGKNAGASAPAVFLLHGARSDAAAFRKQIRFDQLADQYGVVAVYPSSPDTYWNDGRGVELGNEAGRDDAGYLARLVRHLSSQGVIDQAQVYFAGISNGGGMTIRMACDHPKAVAGIAVVATKLFRPFHCSGYRPVPTLFFHGTEDQISPHDGRETGTEGRGFMNKGRTYSSRQSVEMWRIMNKCSAGRFQGRMDAVGDDETSVRVMEFEACAAPLKYYEIIGGGHTWPGARVPERRFVRTLLGPTSQEVDAGKQALELWLDR